jgi:hypothetical protein
MTCVAVVFAISTAIDVWAIVNAIQKKMKSVAHWTVNALIIKFVKASRVNAVLVAVVMVIVCRGMVARI